MLSVLQACLDLGSRTTEAPLPAACFWRARKGGAPRMRAGPPAAADEPPGPLPRCWLFCWRADGEATLA